MNNRTDDRWRSTMQQKLIMGFRTNNSGRSPASTKMETCRTQVRNNIPSRKRSTSWCHCRRHLCTTKLSQKMKYLFLTCAWQVWQVLPLQGLYHTTFKCFWTRFNIFAKMNVTERRKTILGIIIFGSYSSFKALFPKWINERIACHLFLLHLSTPNQKKYLLMTSNSRNHVKIPQGLLTQSSKVFSQWIDFCISLGRKFVSSSGNRIPWGRWAAATCPARLSKR